jgi:signal peptidase II
LVVVAVVTVVADQISKALALGSLAPGESVSVLGSLIELRLVRNPGAAFSIGSSFTWVFTALASVVVVAVIVVARRVYSKMWALTLGLLLAGAAGNLVDRLVRAPGVGRGHVIDFIDYAGQFVGNVADVAIVGAMGMMVIGVMRGVGLDGRTH